MDRHCSGVEIRAEGRRLSGPAIVYGDVSPGHRERFEAGAFDLSAGPTRWLDWDHDATRVIAFTGGGGLTLRADSAGVHVEADLPAIPIADKALAAVRAGEMRGLSVEFTALDETREAGLRLILKAELVGVALVQIPSYRKSVAENRGAALAYELAKLLDADRARLAAAASAAGMAPEALKAMLTAIGRATPEAPVSPGIPPLWAL